MEINIDIRKKHVVLGSVSFVLATGWSAGKVSHSTLYTEELWSLGNNPIEIQDDFTVTGSVTIEGEGLIPPGFCVFSASDSSCPQGLTRKSDFDDRSIITTTIASEVGTTGGSNTHRHLADDFDECDSIGYGSGGWEDNLGNDEYTSYEDTWPPYSNVLICCNI